MLIPLLCSIQIFVIMLCFNDFYFIYFLIWLVKINSFCLFEGGGGINFNKALPFGHGSAPFFFNQLSHALEWLVKNYLNNYYIAHCSYFWWLFFAQPASSSLCATALCWVLTLFEDLNILITRNKTFRPSKVLEFMGITLESVNMQARLPEDKLDKAWPMLLGWSSKWFCHLWHLQSLIGTLQIASFPWLGLCNTSLTFPKGPLHVPPFSWSLEWYQPLSSPLHWNLPRHPSLH